MARADAKPQAVASASTKTRALDLARRPRRRPVPPCPTPAGNRAAQALRDPPQITSRTSPPRGGQHDTMAMPSIGFFAATDQVAADGEIWCRSPRRSRRAHSWLSPGYSTVAPSGNPHIHFMLRDGACSYAQITISRFFRSIPQEIGDQCLNYYFSRHLSQAALASTYSLPNEFA
jgi:hypothetical protein